MTAKKKADFIVNGTIDHPVHGRLERGQVLKLEVGDDGLPTSEMMAQRTRPVGERVGEDDSEGMSSKDAKGEAKAIIDKAKADAKVITDKALADAEAITEKANTDAAQLLADAGKK